MGWCRETFGFVIHLDSGVDFRIIIARQSNAEDSSMTSIMHNGTYPFIDLQKGGRPCLEFGSPLG